MIVNNYWNLRRYIDSNNYPNTSSLTRYEFGLRYKNPYSIDVMTDSSCKVLTSCSDSMLPWNIFKGLFLRVGSGTSTPTLDDYWMIDNNTDVDVTDAFINYTSSCIVTCEDGKSIARFVASGNNPTESAITITELSICKQVMVNYGLGYSNYCPYIMFVHETLSSPITVQPREGFHLPFDWTAS